MWHGINVYRRGEDYIEAWCFATERNHHQLTQFVLNHKIMFEQFIDYFNQQAHDFISTTDTQKLAQFRKGVDLSFDAQLAHQDQNIQDFLQQIQLKKFFLKDDHHHAYLTQREFKCLLNASRGQTAKQIGQLLRISPRTVETHLRNIKTKTGLQYQSQLIDLFHKHYSTHMTTLI